MTSTFSLKKNAFGNLEVFTKHMPILASPRIISTFVSQPVNTYTCVLFPKCDWRWSFFVSVGTRNVATLFSLSLSLTIRRIKDITVLELTLLLIQRAFSFKPSNACKLLLLFRAKLSLKRLWLISWSKYGNLVMNFTLF